MGPQIWLDGEWRDDIGQFFQSEAGLRIVKGTVVLPTSFAYSFDLSRPLEGCAPVPCHTHPPRAQPRRCFTANKNNSTDLLLLFQPTENPSLPLLQHSTLREREIDFTPPFASRQKPVKTRRHNAGLEPTE
jgi:hypothetical protein